MSDPVPYPTDEHGFVISHGRRHRVAVKAEEMRALEALKPKPQTPLHELLWRMHMGVD